VDIGEQRYVQQTLARPTAQCGPLIALFVCRRRYRCLCFSAKTQRSRRAMDAKAPKLIENVKASLGIKGPKMSQLVGDVLKDLHKFKQPNSTLLTKRNITRPFEDVSSVEFLGKVNDASLFTYGSHSKKRPHNLVSTITATAFPHALLSATCFRSLLVSLMMFFA
jgi:hypothetical protein